MAGRPALLLTPSALKRERKRTMANADDPAEALRQIIKWADAYSDAACEPLSDEELERASAALSRVGVSLSALHARWARILVEDIGKLAREGLAAAEGRRVTH